MKSRRENSLFFLKICIFKIWNVYLQCNLEFKMLFFAFFFEDTYLQNMEYLSSM